MSTLPRTRGITLPEVLVAMALGVVLTFTITTLHARMLHLAAESGRAADAQDTLRIGLALLEYELAHAGYWGLVTDASHIDGRRTAEAPLTVNVAGDCGSGWAIDLDRPLQAWSHGWPLECSPYGNLAPLSGTLVLRRVDPQLAAPEAGRLQLQSDPWSGQLTADGETAAAGADTRDLVARAYYISPRSTGDPLRPSLRRKTLQRGPRVVDEELLPGVAALEILLGIDTDAPGSPGHGTADAFVPPESAAGMVVAARIRLRSDGPAGLTMERTVLLRNGPLQ